MKKGLDQGINSDPVNAGNRELSGFNGRVQGGEINELTDPQKEKGSRRKREQTEEGADTGGRNIWEELRGVHGGLNRRQE